MTKSRPFLVPVLALAALVILIAFIAGGCGDDGAGVDGGTEEPLAIFLAGPATTPAQAPDPDGENVLATIRLEVARTPEQKATGLMNRSSLPDDAGMLFIYDQPARGAFWMKNTYIPLSIAFIRSDGVILDIQDMEPESLTPHQPREKYSYAIEVNQGLFAQKGVKPGDSVWFEGLPE